MNNEQLTAYLQDESYLYTLSYEELKTLVVQYPYATNLRILLLKKSHIEQNKDFDRNLQMAATYATNRRFLYKLVKKLKSLQAMPENVILAEDYLELTELSNIEKILSIRQVSETPTTAENTRTLSADFSLNFEPPTHTQEDDEVLFDLSTISPNKPNLDIMSDEEVDFLVDDIVSKFKNPTPTVADIEHNQEQEAIIDKQVTVSNDFQAVFPSNSLENDDNTGGGGIIDETHDTNLNTYFFDDNDDPEWTSFSKEDTVIDEEISKLEVFNLPLIGNIETPETIVQTQNSEVFDTIEKAEIVTEAENIEDFHPFETSEIVAEVENIELFHPVEKAEIVTEAENIEVFHPIETAEIVAEVENIEVFHSVETAEIVAEVKNIEAFHPVETAEIVAEVENIEVFHPVETAEIVAEVENIEVFHPVETAEIVAEVENIEQPTEIVSPIENIENIKSTESSFVEYVVNENVSAEMQDLYYTSFAPNVSDEDKTTEEPILHFIEEVAPPKIVHDKPIYGFIENIEQIELASHETPVYDVLEDFKEIKTSDIFASYETPLSNKIEDFKENKTDNPDFSNAIPQPDEVEDFKEKNTEEGKNAPNTPIYSVMDDFKGRKTQVENEDMGQIMDNRDWAIKKKDIDKPVIEMEIINHSKAMLVESIIPPSVSDPSTSFSEWLQQFQKPKPSDISLSETENRNIKELAQDVDNQAIVSKNKQRKYHLDSLAGIFEKENGLPNNLFYGLSSTDITANIVEKQADNTHTVSDTDAFSNDFLNTSATASDDKDLEWPNIPIDNNLTTEATETADEAEEHAPQKKKRKKIMHELAAQSLIQDGDIISEPLADIYAAQGLNDKAIEMYQQLSLHIPEKSDFFAAKIEKLRTTT